MDIGAWDVHTDEEVNDYLAYGEFIISWRLGPIPWLAHGQLTNRPPKPPSTIFP
jgi:hypothetical protein